MENNNSNKIFGLDLGTSSIGWSVIANDESKIYDCGVIKFKPPVDENNAETPNQIRAKTRMVRKQLFRKNLRKKKVLDFFYKNGVLNKEMNLNDFFLLNPYELRLKALRESITEKEFARICYHMAQRRGYNEGVSVFNDSDGEDEQNKIFKGYGDIVGINQTEKEIFESGSLTAGEYFYELNKKGDKIRKRFLTRRMYVDELNLIISHQKKNINILKDEKLINELCHPKTGLLFFQRPLKSQKDKIGKCTFEGKKTRIKKGHPTFERFIAFQFINNLSWIEENGNLNYPNKDQRDNLINLFQSKESFTFKSIIECLGFNSKQAKNIDFKGHDMKSKIYGSKTYIKLSKLFGEEKYKHFSIDRQIEIWNLFNFMTLDDRIGYFKNVLHFNEEQLTDLKKIKFNDDYGSLSKNFIDKILPFLEQGYNYYNSVLLAGIVKAFGEKRWSVIKESDKERLFFDILDLKNKNTDDSILYERIQSFLCNEYGLSDDDVNKIYNSNSPNKKVKTYFLEVSEKTANPAVNKSLSLIRKLVNELIKKYGNPFEIRIEMAREFGQSFNQIKEEASRQREQNFKNDKIKKELFKLNIKDSNKNIKKYKLWEECGGVCVFTGRKISISDLFSGEVDVEHIVPRSVSPNSSLFNLTLCYREENQLKNDKTPFQFYHENSQVWKDIKCRAKSSFSSEKYSHFISSEIPSFEKFVSSQLNDTRYIMTEAKKYLISVCKKITTTNGKTTFKLRQVWGLDSILGGDEKSGKNKSDNRNHAIDAIVVAFTNDKLKHFVLNEIRKNNYSLSESKKDAPVPYNLKEFQRDVTKNTLNSIVVHDNKVKLITNRTLHVKKNGSTHIQKTKSIRGKMHDEMPFGKIMVNGVVKFAKRKPITSFETFGSIEKIVDSQIKKSVIKHLDDYVLKNFQDKDFGNKKIDDLSDAEFKKLCKKAFSDKDNPVYLLNSKGEKTQIIKKIRFAEKSDVVQVKKSENKYFSPNNNVYWVAEWNELKQKYDIKTISFLELIRLKKEKIDLNSKPTKRICLKKNDLVIASSDIPLSLDLNSIDKEILSESVYRVQKMSGKTIELIKHTKAIVKENTDIKISNTEHIQKYNLRLINVDITGNVTLKIEKNVISST